MIVADAGFGISIWMNKALWTPELFHEGTHGKRSSQFARYNQALIRNSGMQLMVIGVSAFYSIFLVLVYSTGK